MEPRVVRRLAARALFAIAGFAWRLRLRVIALRLTSMGIRIAGW
jgi:hypothetical protein